MEGMLGQVELNINYHLIIQQEVLISFNALQIVEARLIFCLYLLFFVRKNHLPHVGPNSITVKAFLYLLIATSTYNRNSMISFAYSYCRRQHILMRATHQDGVVSARY